MWLFSYSKFQVVFVHIFDKFSWMMFSERKRVVTAQNNILLKKKTHTHMQDIEPTRAAMRKLGTWRFIFFFQCYVCPGDKCASHTNEDCWKQQL